MTDQPTDGGPAFPRENQEWGVPGMSLRDWFAGQVLAGDAANNEEGCYSHDVPDAKLLKQAKLYYRIADAMLAARGQA